MDINNVIKINDIVSRYNIARERYSEIVEQLIEMKDKLSDLELERAELFNTLSDIRLEEVNFINSLKDSPEQYSELMDIIQKSAIAQSHPANDDK